MNKKSLVKLLFLVMIVMFLFPWVLVSCGGEKIMSATGFQIETGQYATVMKTNGFAASQNFQIILRTILFIVLFLSVIGFFVGFAPDEDGDMTLAFSSSFQSLILVGLYIGAPIAFYNEISQGSTSSSEIAAMSGFIHFEFQPAFYLTLLLSLGCTFLCFAVLREQDAKDAALLTTDAPPRPSLSPTVDSSSLLFCPSCGYGNPKGSKFCLKCGTALTVPDDPAKKS
ncbi:zinc ribbon domain-containing protein [Candidatus Cryosericum septentrionale]|jgi:hypothetical protein|uniref:Zinc ribbon domain-containing protein n=1 Tax=Candidatus Cryosericum septentrionale TaxID=2290913 RepID=A0A398DZV6_9BACT|nr:zinc ribbon domain-containing protein [Candidatus Cryosericum septentrionale]RIE17678.1 zinc ribbon domain-containing protein [Candidatus Cryosericum septentrionale]